MPKSEAEKAARRRQRARQTVARREARSHPPEPCDGSAWLLALSLPCPRHAPAGEPCWTVPSDTVPG